MRKKDPKAFTLVELLVVIAIISLLMSLLLPAAGKVRDQARMTISRSNLRNLGTAHANYAADWGDRQFTLSYDNLAAIGGSVHQAIDNYKQIVGREHPPLILGWARNQEFGTYGLWRFFVHEKPEYECLAVPMVFDEDDEDLGFGYFRLPNVKQFNQYVGGRFYDKTFYAPKDTVVYDYIRPTFEDPAEYTPTGHAGGYVLDRLAFASYCLSPAALFNPEVMRDPERGGWQDPFGFLPMQYLAGGFKAPSMSQALYPTLKTHMIEHNWVQGPPTECNSRSDAVGYNGCEPYYFNHGIESVPICLFYDGHVDSIGVREAMDADSRMCAQNGTEATDSDASGLWSRDTPMEGKFSSVTGGSGGYFMDDSYDTLAYTSFHILTTNGIQGRDIIGD